MYAFPGILFPMGGNKRKSFPGISAEARFLVVKSTDKQLPKNRLFFRIINVPFDNNCFLMQKIILRKIKNFTKRFLPNYGLL